jgi:hypothetical protein
VGTMEYRQLVQINLCCTLRLRRRFSFITWGRPVGPDKPLLYIAAEEILVHYMGKALSPTWGHNVPRASLQFPEHNNALTAMPSPIQYWLQISFKNENFKI